MRGRRTVTFNSSSLPMLMRKAIPTAPSLPFYCTNRLPADGRKLFLRLREAEDPETYAGAQGLQITVSGWISTYATHNLLGEPLHLSYGLSSRLVSDASWYPIFGCGVNLHAP